MIYFIIISLIVFPLYRVINYSYFPVTVLQCSTDDFIDADAAATNSPCSARDTELEVRVSFQIYALSIMTFLGYCMLCIFLPTGMQGIPFEYAA